MFHEPISKRDSTKKKFNNTFIGIDCLPKQSRKHVIVTSLSHKKTNDNFKTKTTFHYNYNFNFPS